MSNYVDRIIKLPKQSFFLFGPRGTGKTTLIRNVFPDAYYVSLLDEALYHDLLSRPGAFASMLRAVEPDRWVVVDEVQRLPSLLNEVHRFIEDRRMKFALTGSSARKLRRGGVNLLGGRALVRQMHSFVPEELGSLFDLDRALRLGSLPLVWFAPDPEATLAAYVQTYLKEEIKAEAFVRSLPGFARFLPIAGICHAQVTSISGIARDCGVGRTTVSGYLGLLEDTLLTFRLPAFEARLRVRERRHPKLYWADPGIARAVAGKRGPVQPEESGALFEGWVAAILRSYRDYRDAFDEFGYWAPSDAAGTEVDFILRRGSSLVAVEVKSSVSIGREHMRGLRAIAALPGLKRRLLVCRSERPQRTEDGIDVLPARAFADLMAAGELWS